MEDKEIIKKCLSGDKYAFSELVNRYKKLVFSTAYRMLGNYEEAEDASQEVFIRIYNSLNRYDSLYKFSTWSMRITTNYCLDMLRKRKGDVYSLESQYDLQDDSLSPEEHYIKQENQNFLNSAQSPALKRTKLDSHLNPSLKKEVFSRLALRLISVQILR